MLLNNYSALLKNKISNDDIQKSLKELISAVKVVSINKDTVLENDCTILYSEDMQHKQVIDNKIEIINPFSPQ